MERGEASGEFSKMNAILGEEIEETRRLHRQRKKEKAINLTEDGVKKVENFFHIEIWQIRKIWRSSIILSLLCARII